MGIVATGQVSIIDYTDAPSLSSFITSNLPKTQLFDTPNNKTIPDWGATNLVLTPSLFIAGTPDDKISDANVKSATWYDLDAPTTPITTAGNFVVGNKAAKFTLTVKANIMTDAITSKTYICDIVYTDPTSGFDLRIKADITFSRMKNGQTGNTGANGADAIFVTAWAPDGNLFKNDAGGDLKAQVDTYRGGGAVVGTAYVWFIQETGAPDQGAGLGWKKIDATNQGTIGIIGAINGATITIQAKAVLNVTSFKVKVTYNSKDYFDTVTFIDQTDPIQVTVISSNGEIFKNGQITTELTARLFQNGAEIDTAGTAYKYKWTARDRNGNQVAGFSKTTKKITVTNTDVTQRATFIVEVES